MPERETGPQIYSIAAHRGFADALVAGLIPRYGDKQFGLARLTLLLPSQRAVRTVTEAFVRASNGALLLPRMTVVGDLDVEEALGPLLDPLAATEEIRPAANPNRRWLKLAEFLRGDKFAPGQDAVRLRQAREIGRTIDRLLVEDVDPLSLLDAERLGIVFEQAEHWQQNTRLFLEVAAKWQAELARLGEVDGPERCNRLFDHAARCWREVPPRHPVVAAGITSASPALARLLRTISELPRSAVILPDVDLDLDEEVWEALGSAGMPAEQDGQPFGKGDALTHPQYHLKLLLNRMGIHRGEVQPWHRSGLAAAPPERSRAISNLFLPPRASASWVDLPADQRRLSGVRLMETAHPGEEAQAIAVLVREALETPERRVAVVTPDRKLAARVVALLHRWGIEADDSAGTPLGQTAVGRVLRLLAELLAEDAAPVPLIALLSHPKVMPGEGRPVWLEQVRALDLALRGPRPGVGLEPIASKAADNRLGEWWAQVEALVAPLFALPPRAALRDCLDALVQVGEALGGDGLWADADGRALARFVEDLRDAALHAGTEIDRRELPAVLNDAMECVAVRPPWGGHPRVSIYGLLEARMARADLVICAGLVEGVWPASSAPDALLPPAVLRALGVPGPELRVGLSAHDLAAALGAPEVVLSYAHRDESGPVVPSRFVLRVQALLGGTIDNLESDHRETDAAVLARLLDDAPMALPCPRPEPEPSAEQRRVDISATGLDRLRSDPFQFYASSILRLRKLEALDAEPGPAWRGTAVHAVLDAWHKAGDPPGRLPEIAKAEFDRMSSHPLMRRLWRSRLLSALAWIDERIAADRLAGRVVLDSEAEGSMLYRDIRIHGRADRIDRLPGGGLAIVDYKTGTVPKARMVEAGYSLQLGLLGLIASRGGFEKARGEPEEFEYWSLGKARGKDTFGFVESLVKEGKKRSGIPREEFLPETARYLDDALDRWILGSEPFTARLNPDIGGYNDYDHLMRLDEWIGLLGDEGEAA